MGAINLNPRDQKHDVHGRLFQARMWRQYAMEIKYDLHPFGIGRRWCLEIGRMNYVTCVRRARVNLYLARRLNRRSS